MNSLFCRNVLKYLHIMYNGIPLTCILLVKLLIFLWFYLPVMYLQVSLSMLNLSYFLQKCLFKVGFKVCQKWDFNWRSCVFPTKLLWQCINLILVIVRITVMIFSNENFKTLPWIFIDENFFRPKFSVKEGVALIMILNSHPL